MEKGLKRTGEIILFVFVLCILGGILFRYYGNTPNPISSIRSWIANRSDKKQEMVVVTCNKNEIKIDVPDGSLCRNKIEPSVYVDIYDKYPLHPDGKEIIYRSTTKGSIEVADKLLENEYQLPRYESVKIDDITWQEDPYSERYWRFNFYSLYPLNDLIYAYNKTNDDRYKDKAIELINDFADNGVNQEHAWDDYHGAALRSINLVNAWWNLREHNALPVETSNKILGLLKKHGDFLVDETHYEPQHNHGINEASALLLISSNFPEIDGSTMWLDLSKKRLSEGLDYLVDDDGVLIENSPYYHFYALEKYWEIYKYTQRFHIDISSSFMLKIKKMISYSAYILQPDLGVPTISASLKRNIAYSGLYKEMSELDPELKYVLTQGKEGTSPKELNIQHPTAGQTIMRSGWGTGNDFTQQTQLIFNVGAYRTKHSHLDALSFNLFGSGIPLFVDSGLYTYEEGDMKNYFYGTSAHNTVVIDGKDQQPGKVSIGKSYESDGIFYQSAEEELNKGVLHKRAIALINKNIAVIVDDLQSDTEHLYQQKFHLNPDLNGKIDEFSVDGIDKDGNQKVSINQLIKEGLTITDVKGQQSPPDGICSSEYGKIVSCDDISYSIKTKSTQLVTLIEIGPHDPNITYTLSSNRKTVNISTINKKYAIDISQTEETSRAVEIKDQKMKNDQKVLNDMFDKKDWIFLNDFGLNQVEKSQCTSCLDLKIDKNQLVTKTEKNIDLNLTNHSISLDMKASRLGSDDHIYLSLSNNNWSSSANISLSNIYRTEYIGTWLSISLGLGDLRKTNGGWDVSNGFDWSKIDKIKITLSNDNKLNNTVVLKNFSIIPDQSQGKVVIVFDDGSSSDLPAIQFMNNNGLKGNLAVIGERLETRIIRGYFSVDDLKKIQNEYGWNIANHSMHHKNGLDEYFLKGNLEGLEKDILDGAEYLEKNGLNSAPNWYIYPNGATNSSIKDIVGKYYKFARTIQNAPEVFPYSDNFGVKTMSVQNFVKPEDVILAVKDAKKYNQTLFLTLHKINTDRSKPNDLGSYYLDDFEKIIKAIKEEKINVKTLSELDQENGFLINQPIFTDKIPSQIELKIRSTDFIKPKTASKSIFNISKENLIPYSLSGLFVLLNSYLGLKLARRYKNKKR